MYLPAGVFGRVRPVMQGMYDDAYAAARIIRSDASWTVSKSGAVSKSGEVAGGASRLGQRAGTVR